MDNKLPYLPTRREAKESHDTKMSEVDTYLKGIDDVLGQQWGGPDRVGRP